MEPLLLSNSLVLDTGQSLFLLLGLSACRVSELNTFDSEICSSVRLSLWHPAVQEEQQRIGIAPLRLGQGSLWSTVYFPGSTRRKQTETDGNTRNHAEFVWRFTRSGFVAILSAKKSRFRENHPKTKIISVAAHAEPRGEKKNLLLCEFWAVKNF